MASRSPAARRARRSGRGGAEGGAVLLVTVVVLALVSLLGLAFALLAEDENRMAANLLRGNQALYAAESTARCVRGWFEDPDPATGFHVPAVAEVDRSARRVDPDGNGTHSPYASAPPPWNVVYREGTDDLFERPYRGSPALSFEGDARGPDIRIRSDGSPAERDFLDRLAGALFPDFPSSRERARIARVELFAPPVVKVAGRVVRLGIVTVSVTVRILDVRVPGREREVATRTVRAVLGEPPYRSARGPVLAAGDIDLTEGIEARWGLVAARGDVTVPPASSPAVPSGWPRRASGRPLLPDGDGDGTADDTDADGREDWDEWWTLEDDTIEDPWFFVSSGGRVDPAPAADGPDDLPWPFDPAVLPGGSWVPDADRSNLLQAAAVDPVPDTGYERWKSIARSGVSGSRYYAYDAPSGLWRDDGSGEPVTVGAATHGRGGVFFFDTLDGHPPDDADGDGRADNLAPPVVLAGDWWSSGVLFIASERVRFDRIPERGRTRTLTPPGEPCVDGDGDGHCGEEEPFLRLGYPPDPLEAGAQFTRLALDRPSTGPPRRLAGPPVDRPLAFEGLMIVAGDLVTGGSATILGSLIVGGSVMTEPDAAPGVVTVLADPWLMTGLSPASGTGAPRTFIVSWQVERQVPPMPVP